MKLNSCGRGIKGEKEINIEKQAKIFDINIKSHYEFMVVSVWINWAKERDGSVIKKQVAVIGLRNKNNELYIIHPLSSFILNWKWRQRKFNTQRKHANNIVKFLNYLLHQKKPHIKNLSDLDIVIGTEYLNSLTNDYKKRGTIIDAGRSLTAFYIWLSENNCLPNVDRNYIESVKKKNVHNNTVYYESLFHPILPQHTKSNRKHLLPVKYIPFLLEVCELVARPIAFGVYLQIFGGLRAGEIVNLKRTYFKKDLTGTNFLLDIKNQQFRTDVRDSSGTNYVKKRRKQQVLQIKDWGSTMFKEHVEIYKKKDVDNTGALFINRDGKPMTGQSYSQYFYKVKNKFIEFLNEHGSVEDKVIAADLRVTDWGTHIGRGTFTNLAAEEIDNPAQLMFLRGDSNLLSSLPYLAKTERVRKKIEERMNHMHTEYIPRLIDREKK